jgi:hypothetical protein
MVFVTETWRAFYAVQSKFLNIIYTSLQRKKSTRSLMLLSCSAYCSTLKTRDIPAKRRLAFSGLHGRILHRIEVFHRIVISWQIAHLPLQLSRYSDRLRAGRPVFDSRHSACTGCGGHPAPCKISALDVSPLGGGCM